MEIYRKCSSCNVDVSSDLSHCPLCGKYLLDDRKNEQTSVNKYSFPRVSMKEVQRAKWINIIRILFWLAAIITTAINLLWETTPYYFPYVIAALFVVMQVFIIPFSQKQRYVKKITWSAILVSLFLIFIDAYDYFTCGTPFGWALIYTVPFLLASIVIASAIICLASRRNEIDMLKSVGILMIYSIIYFLVVILAFDNVALWPSLVFTCVAVGWFLLLQVIKRNLLWKELAKNFHL